MSHPLKQLRDLIINESKVTSGTVIKLDDDETLVATRFGIKKMAVADPFVKNGDKVTVENNIVTGVDRSGSVPVFVR